MSQGPGECRVEREQLLRNQTCVWFRVEEVDEKTVSTGIRNLGDEYPSLAGSAPPRKKLAAVRLKLLGLLRVLLAVALCAGSRPAFLFHGQAVLPVWLLQL